MLSTQSGSDQPTQQPEFDMRCQSIHSHIDELEALASALNTVLNRMAMQGPSEVRSNKTESPVGSTLEGKLSDAQDRLMDLRSTLDRVLTGLNKLV